MSKFENVPHALKPFAFHNIAYEELHDSQVVADCPFCGKERKLYINPKTGQWDCKSASCSREGNVYAFLEQWVEFCKEHTSPQAWRALHTDRGLPEGIFKGNDLGFDGRSWLIPVRNENGTVMDVRVWRPGKDTIGTAGCDAHLWNMPDLANPRKKDHPVYLCEGEWDGMAMEWMLRQQKQPGVVVAVPGAKTFKTEWVRWFNHRDVIVCYDNDEAGDAGFAKVVLGKKDANGNLVRPGMLRSNAKSLRCIRWAIGLPEKWDVRDQFTKGGEKAWKAFTQMIQPVPRGVPLGDAGGKSGGKPIPAPENAAKSVLGASSGAKSTPGKAGGRKMPFSTLLEEYHKWLKLDAEAVGAIKIAKGVVLSNQWVDEPNPLWVFFCGPPGSGKTAGLMPLAETGHCIFRSSLGAKELVSGYPGNPDPSLLAILDGLTLILKDFTEILDSPQPVQDEVFKTLRGAYDGHVIRSYGNGVLREYKLRFSMLAGVTNAIHGRGRATMGERTLKYQVVPQGSTRDSSAIIRAAMGNIGRENAMLKKLGEMTKEFLDRECILEECLNYISPAQETRLAALAEIIAHLRAEVDRAKFTDDVLYRPQAEVATRIGVQLKKMAMVIAAVEGKGYLTQEDYALVERVAFDTAIGWHLDIVNAMMVHSPKKPVSLKDISTFAALPSTNTGRKMDDLTMLNVVKKEQVLHAGERMPRSLYSVSDHIKDLWHQARVGQKDHYKRAFMVRRKRTKETEA